MSVRLCALVGLAVVLAVGCGPARGLRLENVKTPAEEIGAESPGGAAHLLSATTTLGTPYSLAAGGDTIWASTFESTYSDLQTLSSRTAQVGGVVEVLERSDHPAAIAATHSTLWMLVLPLRGMARLFQLRMNEPNMQMIERSPDLFWKPQLPQDSALALPRDSQIAGATDSTLWLVSGSANRYSLWRIDGRTARASRFALASDGRPGVVVDRARVYVLLRTNSAAARVLQTRDAAGRILTQSAPIPLTGAIQPSPLAVCDGTIFGWTRHARGSAVFRLGTTGALPGYSPDFVRSGASSRVNAIATSDDCRGVWVATSNALAGPRTVPVGAITELRAPSLAVVGRLSAWVDALLWAHGSLWASDRIHHAVLRIR